MHEEKQRVFLWWLPAAVYTAFILVLSTRSLPVKIPGSYTDKILHFFAYGILSTLIYLPLRLKSSPSTETVLISILVSLVIGILDETIQSFNPYRTSSFADLLADASGALVAVLLCRKILPGMITYIKRG